MKNLKNNLFILLIVIFSNYSLNQKNYFSPNVIIPFMKQKIQETKKIFSYPQKLIQSEYVQKNKSKLLIGAGVFAVSGYLLYRYFRSKKKEQINSHEKIDEQNNENKKIQEQPDITSIIPNRINNTSDNSIKKVFELADLLLFMMVKLSPEIETIIKQNHDKHNNKSWRNVEEAKGNYNIEKLIPSLEENIKKNKINRTIEADEVSDLFTNNKEFINFLICNNLLMSFIDSINNNNNEEIKVPNHDALIETENVPKAILPLIEYCDYFYKNMNEILKENHNKKDIVTYIGKDIGYFSTITTQDKRTSIQTIGNKGEHEKELNNQLNEESNMKTTLLVKHKKYSEILFNKTLDESFKTELIKKYNSYEKKNATNYKENNNVNYTTLNKNMYRLRYFLKK